MLCPPLSVSQASEGGAVKLEFLAPAESSPSMAPAKGPAGEPAIRVTGTSAATTTTIVVCQNPPLSHHQYVVRGEVKYEGVIGDGYLELLNNFGPQGEYFTRSLSSSGPMRKLSGASPWRHFELPFYAEPGMRPKQLTLNVVLPGPGDVTIAQPTLLALSTSSEWWSPPQAGLIGGGLGAFIGMLGGLIGIATAWCKSRPLTLSLFAVALFTSGVSLLAGVIAIFAGQRWHVCYPLLLVGLIGLTVFGVNLWNLLQRFQHDELRRIAAVDA
jgi:hypothetical protein